ncbi:MAG: tetratricopeptide repeat protein [Ktedonobacteraceae bacterium]
MEELPQVYDVCIVCALPEEARAFLEVVQRQCENPLEEGISPRYHYSYRFTSLKNDKDEPLKLHISWLPRYGPQEMTLHLSRVLEEYQPRIAIMTGICAGDAQRVQLGDLVVAERTFTYDNGKFTLDGSKKVHLHDTMTYQLDANTLQFLGLFDKWKPLVARLKLPSSRLEQPKRRKIACHIKPMASGSAVRADHPFEDVQAPVRGTVAIDMEGAAFGLVMSRHAQIPWLVVKGVCDYADQDKNDVFHAYAARGSALYALSFLRAYVTDERFPQPEQSSSTSHREPPGVWNVPYRRNPHFTGRDELLDQLTQQLSPEGQKEGTTTRRAALTQPQAIKGLGGIGKTQVAVEYAYRSQDVSRYTHTLWVNAASEGALLTSFAELAELLPAFPMKGETDQRKLVEAIKRWLEQCQQRWLLICDNADDIALVGDYLPQGGNGSILLTTRANAVGSLATSVEVETMGFIEGTHLLLRRAQRFEHASDEEINQAGNIVVALDHFPLALDQAGAYIEETQCSFVDYLDIYQNHRQDLLAQRGAQVSNYPNSVATTWSLSFRKVQQANPAAAELLQLCSFLAPDRIQEELLRDGAAYWPVSLQQAVADPFMFQQLIAELLKFSLVKHLAEEHALGIHRLVQAVQRDRMELEIQRQWAGRVIGAVNTVFPKDTQDPSVWQQCLRYLDQSQACSALIEQYMLPPTKQRDMVIDTCIPLRWPQKVTLWKKTSSFLGRIGCFLPTAHKSSILYKEEAPLDEAADLLNRTGLYLHRHALYPIAESLYQQALKITKQQFGIRHPHTASSLENLALLYKALGRYKEVEPLLVQALAINKQRLGAKHPGTAFSLNNLAGFYSSQGRYKEAEALYQQALSIRERELGTEHPDTATSLNNLALLYKDQGRYEEVEALYQRALKIEEQQFGIEHLETATTLNNLADLYQALGKYEEAEELYQRSLKITEQQLGVEHPDIALTLNNLALLYEDQGRYEEAEALYQRSLKITEQRLGANHPKTATSLDNLASLYEDQGRYEEAEALYQRALAILEQQLGMEHLETATCMNNLASLYRSQGRYKEAELLYQRALKITEKRLGTNHPKTALKLNNLAFLYQDQGRYEEAEAFYRRALAIFEQQPDMEHLETATCMNNLASLYEDLGRYEEAEVLYQGIQAILELQPDMEDPQT